MKELNIKEQIQTNGGTQQDYDFGYRFGKAVAETCKMVSAFAWLALL